MAETLIGGGHRPELVNAIRQVRGRWRLKLLLQGAVILLIGTLITLTAASFYLQTSKFSPASVIWLRVALFTVVAGLTGLWLIRPLSRRVTDMQVALYLEENEPSLQAAILSAVDVGAAGGPASVEVPPAIMEKMVEQAIARCRAVEGGRGVGQKIMRRYAVVFTSVAAAGILMLIVGPEFLRQGASALLVLTKSAEAASPYAINVTPGDQTIPKGADQAVTAKLAGFQSSDVSLMIRTSVDGKYERMPLVATSDPWTFEGMLFDVKKPVEYYVEADGVKSPSYALKIVELPAVDQIELEYVYPAYTGMAPQKVQTGGDVAAVRGTEVRMRITSTMPDITTGGRLKVDPNGDSQLAEQPDKKLTGSFKMDKDGFYQVELDGPHGEKVVASPKYTVDVIDDLPPTVSFDKPKRDIALNPVEEAALQVRADDDFGVKQLDLIYS